MLEILHPTLQNLLLLQWDIIAAGSFQVFFPFPLPSLVFPRDFFPCQFSLNPNDASLLL